MSLQGLPRTSEGWIGPFERVGAANRTLVQIREREHEALFETIQDCLRTGRSQTCEEGGYSLMQKEGRWYIIPPSSRENSPIASVVAKNLPLPQEHHFEGFSLGARIPKMNQQVPLSQGEELLEATAPPQKEESNAFLDMINWCAGVVFDLITAIKKILSSIESSG